MTLAPMSGCPSAASVTKPRSVAGWAAAGRAAREREKAREERQGGRQAERHRGGADRAPKVPAAADSLAGIRCVPSAAGRAGRP